MNRLALHKAIDQLSDLIKSHAYRLARASGRWDDREDFEQEAYLAMLEAAPRYDGSTKFGTFTSLRMRGAMIDHQRKWGCRDSRVQQPWRLVPIPADAPRTWPAPPHDLDAPLLYSQLHAALARLPDRDRQILYRYFFDEASQRAMADEFDRSPSWLTITKCRALERLKAELLNLAP